MESEFFIQLRLLKSNSINFQHALPVYFYLLHKQAVHGLFDHETLGRCCHAFRLFLASFCYFVKKSICSDRILTFGIRSICSPAKGGTGCYRFNYQPGS